MVNLVNGAPTLQQAAYARRVWSADGKTKQQIALDVGYSENAANNVGQCIENTVGFKKEIASLASKSGNLAMKILYEIESRGFKEYSSEELWKALTTISNAWEKFTPQEDRKEVARDNELRQIILNSITVPATEVTNYNEPTRTQ